MCKYSQKQNLRKAAMTSFPKVNLNKQMDITGCQR